MAETVRSRLLEDFQDWPKLRLCDITIEDLEAMITEFPYFAETKLGKSIAERVEKRGMKLGERRGHKRKHPACCSKRIKASWTLRDVTG